MAEGIVLGLNAWTGINTSGDSDAPTWVELLAIKDETLNMETSLSDVTTRQAKGWRLQVGTLSDASVDGTMLYKAGPDGGQGSETGYQLVRDAFFNKSRILMGFYDDDITSTTPEPDPSTVQGLEGGFSVTNFSIGRELEEAMMIDVTFTVRENDKGDGPEWKSVQVSSGP